MKCRRAVVKLGGSVITVKDKPETVNTSALTSTVRALADYYRSGGELVIVHGGGSFGHYTVKRIIDEKGSLDVGDAPIIQASMLRLAIRLLEQLLHTGIPATLHPAHTMCSSGCNLEPLARDLDMKLSPVTYGDAVVSNGRVYIVSGDDLAAEASIRVNANCLIYATNVPGVLGENGKVIRVLRSKDAHVIGGANGIDVTGGMMKKVRVAMSISGKIDVIRIVHYTMLSKALEGYDVGTRVVG